MTAITERVSAATAGKTPGAEETRARQAAEPPKSISSTSHPTVSHPTS